MPLFYFFFHVSLTASIFAVTFYILARFLHQVHGLSHFHLPPHPKKCVVLPFDKQNNLRGKTESILEAASIAVM